MNVELVTIGEELLAGDVVNTNAAWLGRRLTEAGLRVLATTVVGDDAAAITAAVRTAARRSAAVVLTGGLGPTSDDVTADALAALAERPGDVARLPNRVGAAEGLRVRVGGCVAYAVPGVPAEMADMVAASVLPDLLELAGAGAAVTTTLYVALLGESAVSGRLADVEADLAGGPVRLGYLCAPSRVEVRLSTVADTRTAAEDVLRPWVERARAALGDVVSGVDEELESTVHRLLLERGTTVAVAESLTGGLLGAALTSMSGSSATFRGGVTAYATELKSALLAVDPTALAARGAVDAEVARQMAAGVRERLGAGYGLATTGVAGPLPGDGHPPGTVHVAVADADGTASVSLRLRGDREAVRARTVVNSLELLRRRLTGLPSQSGEHSGSRR